MPKQSKSELSDTSDIAVKLCDSRPVCKPLDSFSEIMLFLENPPPWRTLSQDLTPHSDFLIRNSEINANSGSLSNPETFCHFDPDSDEIKRHVSKSLPKTLVCHDMANGYHDDCIIDGTTNSEAYTFYNWAGIDIFCYFSHHLVTIPPVSWINVGHAHGVKVIGTLITEHAEGVTFWNDALASESRYQTLASALVAIAKSFKFDGYLLNIENKIALPEALLSFVRCFHRMLHAELPHATLLWYDSVTIHGKLNWQNSLNDKNRAFFDACDGLFTNYSWSREDVESSAELAGASGRLTDLYIGMDVWGRNFFGGGQFNTAEAVKVARSCGCSIAVFAPAWTHEAQPPDADDVALADELERYDKFLLRDRALWGSLWPFLNTRLPCRLPFQTSFCRGQGRKRYMYGEVLSPSPWYNLRHQQYQPNAAHGPHGYLLSTVAKLDKVKHELYKDKKGIMRVRASFQQPPEKLPSKEAEPAKELTKEPSAESVVTAEADEEADSQAEWAGSAGMAQASVSVHLGQQHKARYTLAHVSGERACLQPHLGDAFGGGSCLMVHPSDKLSPEHRLTRLFHADFRCDEGLIFCVVTKTLAPHPQQTLNVKLSMLNAGAQELLVVLAGRYLAQSCALGAGAAGIQYVYPLRTRNPDVLRDLRTYLLLTQPGFYVPIDNAFGWDVRYYEVTVPGARVLSVSLRTGLASGPILLGHFGIARKTYKTSPGSARVAVLDDSEVYENYL